MLPGCMLKNSASSRPGTWNSVSLGSWSSPGKDHVPLTFGSFWHSFTSFSNVSLAEKESTKRSGFAHSSFDFTWRLPWLENWLTLYSDSIVHDDVSPLAAPRRAAVNPGLYLSHIAKAAACRPPRGSSIDGSGALPRQGGQLVYYEFEYPDGYTNKGQHVGKLDGTRGQRGPGMAYRLARARRSTFSWAIATRKSPRASFPGAQRRTTSTSKRCCVLRMTWS